MTAPIIKHDDTRDPNEAHAAYHRHKGQPPIPTLAEEGYEHYWTRVAARDREAPTQTHMSWVPIRRAVLFSAPILVALVLLGLVAVSHAQEGRSNSNDGSVGSTAVAPTRVGPIKPPAGLLRERGECRNTQHIETCLRGKLRVAYAGLQWARNERLHAVAPYGVQHALRLASALYGIPLSEMRAVGDCESHLNPLAKNRTSTATGVFQWLDGSWRTQGLPGFARTDPYASALAAARAVQRDHGWSQWVCKP